MLVIEPQISFNLKSVPVGLVMYFGESWMPKLSTSTKPGKQELRSASPDATGSSNGAHPARLYHDISEKAAGWARRIDIWSDLERERF